MDKKRIVASLAVFCILAILIYLQYRHWRTFDCGTFWSHTHRIKKLHVFYGIVLIYLAYVVRAIRWQIFLRPVWEKVVGSKTAILDAARTDSRTRRGGAMERLRHAPKVTTAVATTGGEGGSYAESAE